MIQAREYQIEAKNAVLSAWADGICRALLVLPTGCHARGERLLKMDGSTAPVEDIRVGDVLVGSDGTPRHVLSRVEGRAMLYKITPVKGEPFVVTGNHRLTLTRTNEYVEPKYACQRHGGEIIDVSVDEWLKWSNNKRHLYKLVRCGGVERFYGTDAALPIDPYFLGVLLGDGGLTTMINVTTPDPEIVDMLKTQAALYGMQLRCEPAGKAKTYIFFGDGRGRNGGLLHNQLKELGLRRLKSAEKHIPEQYRTADKHTRLQLIAGLLDSDGSNYGGGYDFISKSHALASGLVFLCRSVGLAAYMKPCVKTCGDYRAEFYRVSISGNCEMIPCRVLRKRAKPREQKKNVLRTGFSVAAAGEGDYVGFTVDGDNRYLLDDFTITHNCGKTIVFSQVIESVVREGGRVLILAHRGELLEQAADKLMKVAGLGAGIEKAEQTSLNDWYRVTVGSVQTLMRDKRLNAFSPNYFDCIVVDEAHHVLADSYQKVLAHFPDAKVLGVTATPDRTDMRNLGQYFEHLAYEYTLPKAIRDGYLTPIRAMTVPLKLDITGVSISNGDYSAGELGNALEPYLEQIALEVKNSCAGRRIVAFLPLVKTSQKFRDVLIKHGLRAAEVNGDSDDRAEVIKAFANGEYDVLCNSMLLTEGWDCPQVDCIIPLRATKSRSLYTQMVGRGTRICEGKQNLLLMDFLWQSSQHELCRPAYLICGDEDTRSCMTKALENANGADVDLQDALAQAENDVIAEREARLAERLREMRNRKRKLVDPLQYEMSVLESKLINYAPALGAEAEAPTDKQKGTLEKMGIFPDEIETNGKAQMLIDSVSDRRERGLSTPKQIRFLEARGFKAVGTWSFNAAKRMIDRFAVNGWKTPRGVDAATYIPPAENLTSW